MGALESIRRRVSRPSLNLWQGYAKVYDLGVTHLAPYRELQADILRAVRAHPAVEHDGATRLLEIGCGTGNHLKLLLRRLPRVQGTGLDFSREMLERARQKCAGRTPYRLLCGDAVGGLCALPDKSFDVAILCNAFYPLRDKSAVLREIRRVIADNGVLVLTDPDRHASLNDLFFSHVRTTGLSGLWIIPFTLGASVFSVFIGLGHEADFLDEPQACRLLQDAGFHVVTRARSYGGMNYFLCAAPHVE